MIDREEKIKENENILIRNIKENREKIKEEVLEAKSFIAECLVEDYGYKREIAYNMIEQSVFVKILEQDPDYALYYTVEDWAEEIIKEMQEKTYVYAL